MWPTARNGEGLVELWIGSNWEINRLYQTLYLSLSYYQYHWAAMYHYDLKFGSMKWAAREESNVDAQVYDLSSQRWVQCGCTGFE